MESLPAVVFQFSGKNKWFMDSLYHSIFSRWLCSHGIIQEFRFCGSEGIQPWCSAEKGKFSFFWEGGRADWWYGAAEPRCAVEIQTLGLGSSGEVLGSGLASLEGKVISCLTEEWRRIRKSWCTSLGFEEYCPWCFNITAGAGWVLALLSCVSSLGIDNEGLLLSAKI